MNKPKIHYTADYIINPNHPVSISLIGAGGTGSNILSGLAIIDRSLKALGHPGIDVVVFDDDRITEANIARQLFYEADIGQYKATVLVSRINRAFGLSWEAIATRYSEEYKKANITISAVDTVKSRLEIKKLLAKKRNYETEQNKPHYWIDTGNGKNFGQVYIGTIKMVDQPASETYETIGMLQWPSEYFDVQKDEKSDGPSCSLAQALNKQCLFTNRIIADYCCHTLWTLFRYAKIDYKGIYINLSTIEINKILL